MYAMQVTCLSAKIYTRYTGQHDDTAIEIDYASEMPISLSMPVISYILT